MSRWEWLFLGLILIMIIWCTFSDPMVTVRLGWHSR